MHTVENQEGGRGSSNFAIIPGGPCFLDKITRRGYIILCFIIKEWLIAKFVLYSRILHKNELFHLVRLGTVR